MALKENKKGGGGIESSAKIDIPSGPGAKTNGWSEAMRPAKRPASVLFKVILQCLSLVAKSRENPNLKKNLHWNIPLCNLI